MSHQLTCTVVKHGSYSLPVKPTAGVISIFEVQKDMGPTHSLKNQGQVSASRKHIKAVSHSQSER